MTNEQFEEILCVLRETREFAEASARDSAAHLVIAQEYKKNLGDPLEKALFAGKIIRWLVVSAITVILTMGALAEWWGGVITKWGKH